MNIQAAAKHDVDDHGNVISPLFLPKVSEDFLPVSNHWYCRNKEIAINYNGKKIRLRPEYNVRTSFSYQDPSFEVRLPDAKIGLRLDRKLIDVLMESLADEVDFDTLGREDKLLVLEFLLSPVLGQFERTFFTYVEFHPVENTFGPEPDAKLSLAIQVGEEETPYFCQLLIEEQYLEQWGYFLKNNLEPETANRTELEAQLQVPMTLNYQSVEFTIGGLRDLDRGDIVLLGPADTSYLEIWASGVCLWSARPAADKGSVEIISAQHGTTRRISAAQFGKDTIMSENQDIENVTVPVSFEVGRKDIAVKDLRELTEGSIVSFTHENEKDINIVVNGKEIGWGKLVQVGDAIGVKIERILSNG